MKTLSYTFAATLFAGALAAQNVLAQTSPGAGTGVTGSSPGGTVAPGGTGRSPTDGRSGGAGVPSGTSGATPSTQPQQDMGVNRGAGTSSHGSTARDRNEPRTTERSLTDGRSGGAGYPSSPSGAVPSTNPNTSSGTRTN